jgi:hypothetical protein
MVKAKGNALNITLFFATCIIVLFMLESAFRVMAYFKDREYFKQRQTLHEVVKSHIDFPERSAVTFGYMIRLSENDRIIFELKPGMSVYYRDALVTTNSEGFRDKDYAFEKAEGTVRIVGIGDSIMFGQGVVQDKNYLSFLESQLNAVYPAKKWEVINTAVPDYNSAIEVETLKRKGLRYKPDIVIVGFCPNDYGLPDWIELEEDYFTFHKSFLREFITYRFDYTKIKGQVPDKYKDMAGIEAIKDSMKEFTVLSEKRLFEVIVVLFTEKKRDVDELAIAISGNLGFHVIDLEPVLRRYMQQAGIKKYDGSVLTVPDGHPSALSHKIASEKIAEYIVEHWHR